MRRLAILIGPVFVAVACAVAPAIPGTAATRADVLPLSGELTCGLDGTMTFVKPLPNAQLDPATGLTRIKITATISKCDSSGVVGGTTKITGGALTVTGVLDTEASCGDIVDGTQPDFTFETNRFDAKWTGTVGKSHPILGHSKTAVWSTGDYLLGAWEYSTDSFGETDVFAEQSAIFDLGIDNTFDVVRCGRGENVGGKPFNLGAVQFSAARGSRIVVSS